MVWDRQNNPACLKIYITFIKRKERDRIKYFGHVFPPALTTSSSPSSQDVTTIDADTYTTWSCHQPSLKTPNSFLLGSGLSPNSLLWPMRLYVEQPTDCPLLRMHPKDPQRRSLSVEITATHTAWCLEIVNKYLLNELGNTYVNIAFAF